MKKNQDGVINRLFIQPLRIFISIVLNLIGTGGFNDG